MLAQDDEPLPGASLTVIGAAINEPEADDEDDADDDSELAGPDLVGDDSDDDATRAHGHAAEDADDASVQSADVIPLRAADDEQ